MASDGPTSPRQLEHLDGSRCLAAVWIVCAHYLPKSPKPAFNGAVFRVNVAICFFVIVSGFMTHWAYGSSELSSLRRILHFYVRRLGRVVFTFWVAMAFASCISALQEPQAGLEFWYLVRCFLFLEQWVRWCPNGPSWFVFALMPSWILYPLTQRLIARAEAVKGGHGLDFLMLLLWAISFGPALALFIIQGGNITNLQHHDMCFWPPSQLADFALGACTAAMAQRRLRRPQTHRAEAPVMEHPRVQEGGSEEEGVWLRWLPDLSLACVLAIVFCAPRPPRTWMMHLNGWEPMLDHGLAPVFAAFLYSSTMCRTSPAVRLLSHDALVALGACSFEVYIFQRPVHDVFLYLFNADPASVEVFLAYLLGLWFFAALYAKYIQHPLDKWLREAVSGWAAPREDYRAVGMRDAAPIPISELPEFAPDRTSGVCLPPL